MKATKLLAATLLLGPLLGCEAQYDATTLLRGDDAWACVDSGKDPARCEGISVELEGYVEPYYNSEQFEVRRSRAKESEIFITSEGSAYLTAGSKVRIRGLIVDGGFLSTRTTVAVHESSEVEPAPPRQPSAEEMIARNREMGLKALEEADAAIRKNNADTKRALAAKAVRHQVRNSGDTLIDVYQLSDGRIIGCKTVVYPASAPITTCDGEP